MRSTASFGFQRILSTLASRLRNVHLHSFIHSCVHSFGYSLWRLTVSTCRRKLIFTIFILNALYPHDAFLMMQTSYIRALIYLISVAWEVWPGCLNRPWDLFFWCKLHSVLSFFFSFFLSNTVNIQDTMSECEYCHTFIRKYSKLLHDLRCTSKAGWLGLL